jgi:acetyl/propionyl-CoA carboxylase alpha subunit/acetyl-CoA carboxylase carboxyltransferase component
MASALQTILVANRGEVAVRVFRGAAELGIRTVAVYARDDARCLHVRKADEARPLEAAGPAAYLDADALVAIARDAGADAVHPGYGFLAEDAGFARAVAAAGMAFVGPRADTLVLLGDKARARALAERCGVPILPGTSGPTTVDEARAFLASVDGGAGVVKAIAGGGGRGLRVVEDPAALADAFERCRSEAQAAFGNGELYVERFLPRARHVEVQVIGDGAGHVVALGERECTLQRRHQKLVELAPSPWISPALRARLCGAALRLATEVRVESLATFEFLVDADERFWFIEANPRLQVEHTVTEEVTGVDLVQAQLRVAGGTSLASLGLAPGAVPPPRGLAVELRVNMETMAADASTLPAGGTLGAFDPPSGPGLRVDTLGFAGWAASPRYDSLLAKVVVRTASTDVRDLFARAYRALCEFRIEGVATNVGVLQALVRHPDVLAGAIDTRFVERRAAELVAAAANGHPRRFFDSAPAPAAAAIAGARVDPNDPLAVLAHGKSGGAERSSPAAALPDGWTEVRAPLQGTVVTIEIAPGDAVRAGQALCVLEAMKMEHVVVADVDGIVRDLGVAVGDTVFAGHPLVVLEATGGARAAGASETSAALDRVRPDLAEVAERHALGHDSARPEAVARRRRSGQRTTRENVDDLCDPGSFVEYGPLVIAAQRGRRTVDDLVRNTPADGLVAGVGRVNGALFGDARTRCAVLAYDYTVLAGTQGIQNHRKKDRLFELAARWRLPVVLFTEGGGGRPGDTDGVGVAGLDCLAFKLFGELSGLVPLVGVNSGFCFAGNAALLGCCDVVIAARDSHIGMGGPAMVEGGGLGVFRPEEIGPIDVQAPNGVVDVVVADEAEAVAVAKRYLSYFQGTLPTWECADQRRLRALVPENRLRVYDVRAVVEALADTGSVLELRRHFGAGMVTALARIEGRPIGVVANNPVHLAGAIDPDGADKAARFLQLCDAFDVPVLFLCDTPGIMVGPEIERRANVRHAARMFVVGASLTVPTFTIVLRKSYGLGAMAMAGGTMKAPLFAVSWPTGEFGGMGLEGAVKLGFRKELEAKTDPADRRALYAELVERMYRHGKAVNTASHFEIDDVIDPAESRRWLAAGLAAVPPPAPRTTKKRPCIDTW